MNVYRVVWWSLCAGLAIVGAGVAFLWSITAMLVLFGCAAAVVGAVTRKLAVGWEHANVPLRNVLWQVVTKSLVGGIAVVTLVGWGALLGAWVFLLVVLVTASSPYAVHFCRRWLRPRADQPAPRQRWDPSGPVHPPETEHGPALQSPAEIRSLSDTDLCQAWRASFSALQTASALSQRMRVVETRQNYLDEFERRTPHALTAWLASGARAAGNPSRFVMGGNDAAHPPIDWDGMIHGQDK